MSKKPKVKRPILSTLLSILLVAMALQFILVLGLNVVGYYFDLKKNINGTIEGKITKIKDAVEKVVALGIPLSEIPHFNQELEKEVKGDVLLFMSIIDTSYKITYHSDPVLIGTQFSIDSTLSDESEIAAAVFPYNEIILLSKSIYDTKKTRIGYVIAAYSPDILYRKVVSVSSRMFLASSLAILFGVFLIVFFYKRQIDKPLSSLMQNVEKIKDGRFEEVESVGDKSENEVTQISATIKKLSDELSSSFSEKEMLFEQLKSEEEKLRKIIEKTETGIAVIKDFKIVFVNPGFFKIFNISLKTSLVGKNIIDFFPTQEQIYYKSTFADILETGKRQAFDTVKLHDWNREEIYCTVEATLMETSEWGKNLLNLTFQNITEKMRILNELKNKNREAEQLITKYQTSQLALQVTNEKLENALITIEKANEELKKIDNMKDIFFSTISHELKTPISLIQGYIGILKNDTNIKASTITVDIIAAVERAAKRLVSLTEEIMELMRIRSGKLTLTLNLTYLKLIITSIAAELGPLLENKKMAIETAEIDNLPMVNVDTKKMEHVFRNLFVNCIKFSREGGKIYVTGETIWRDDKKFLKLAIRDEGCGISPFNIDKVFSEFFTLAPPPNLIKETTMRGSGLGLSIAKGVVEAHGGSIWAESPGYDPESFPGTTFHVLIPAYE